MLRKSAEAQLAAALADNRRLAQQYVELQETERKALARELHDELGQYLNVIKLDAVGIRDDSSGVTGGNSPSGEHHRRDLQSHPWRPRHSHSRAAADGPGRAGTCGRVGALRRDLARHACLDASLRLDIAGDFSALPESIMVTLYRLVQEALTNVAKHAAASHVNIRLERRADTGTTTIGSWLPCRIMALAPHPGCRPGDLD